MRTTKDMDYIYSNGEEAILIEGIQKDTRAEIISQFVSCRKERKMTQADLAKRAGIPRPNITRFESGNYNPSLEMMVRIASALGMRLQLGLEAEAELEAVIEGKSAQ